jgi:hypothetical protein
MAVNTTTYSFLKPLVGGDVNVWGGFLNDNADKLDDLFDGTASVTGIDINGGSIDGTLSASGAMTAATIEGVIGSVTPAAGTFTTILGDGSGLTGLIAGILYTRQTANYTAEHQDGVIADTTGGTFTVTLPITPSIGDFVVVADGGDWSTVNLTVARNGSTIAGDAADMTMDVGGVSVTFIYDGTTWQIFTTLASDGTQYASAAQGALADTSVQPSTSPTLADLTLTGGLYVGGAAAANYLDDYEEGTWTPALSDGTNSNATYIKQEGTYTKIGKKVYCTGRISTSSLGSLAGAALYITGLPFTTSLTYLGTLNVGAAFLLNITAGWSVTGHSDENTTRLRMRIWSAATGVSAMTPAQFSSDGDIIFTFDYVVD